MKQKIKTLFPYFLLAIAVIAAYRVIDDLSFSLDLVKRVWSIVTPFFYGFLLAYVMSIPCGGLQKLLGKIKIKFIKKRKKALSLILVYIIFALIFFSALNLVIPAIYEGASLFIANLPSYYESILGFIDYVNGLELFGIHISGDVILGMLQDLFQGLSTESLASPINALFGVASAIFNAFLALISSIYFLLEKDKITAFLRRLLKVFTSSGAHNAIMEYANKLNRNFKQYLFTQTIDGCILGTIVTIEMFIIGSPYALILGIMFGIINYIPFFGSYISSFIAIIVVAFTQGFSTALVTAIVLLVTHMIDGNIIQPRLMSGSFSLSPLLVIISITVGGAVAGILGMILAIPVVAILKDILESIVVYRERQKAEHADDAKET